MVAEVHGRMAAQKQALIVRDGARIIAQPYLDGGARLDMIAPYGATIAECVEQAIPGLPIEWAVAHARVFMGGEIISPEIWPRVRLTPRNDNLPVIVIRVVPGNSGTMRAVLSIAVGVAALALGQIYAAPLAFAAGFGGSALATSVAGGLITGTVLLAGTLLVNSLIPLRRDQSQGAGITASPTYTIQGFRNVPNPDGVVPCVFGKVRFAPPYAALPYTEIEAGETFITALFLLGYGPLEIRDIKLGDTPIEKFKEVTVETRNGYASDAPVTLYPKQTLEERLTVDLSRAYSSTFGPHTRFTASDAQEASIDITFPSGLFWMHTFPTNPPVTQPFPFTVTIKIRMRLNGVGAWTDVIEWPITLFSQKSITVSHRWTLPTRGRYEVEVERLTLDFDDLNVFQQNDQFVSISIWSAIRSFRPEYPLNFNHPLALIAVKAKGSKQLNGVIEDLNCEASRVCKDWDSGTQTWIERETQNPASALRLAMQGPAMAYPLVDDEIDLPCIQDLHDFCVSKSLSYNRVHDFEASVFDTWSDIAAAGRAAPRDDGEKWGVVIDRPQTIVMQHITPRNSWDFAGSRDYVRFPDAFRVKFYDQTNSYKPAERVVPWPGFVGTPLVTESIELPGITDPSAVWIEARRRQYELIYRRDTFTVMQDFEAALARRGDLVKVSHDILLVSQVAARVKSVGADYVMIDSVVTMETGKTYAVRFRSLGPDDASPDLSILRPLKTIVGEHDALFFSGAGTAPQVGDLAMFGESGVETIECVVKDVEGAEDFSRRFKLVAHAPEISTLADAEIPPAWNGRVGEEIGGFIRSLKFNDPRNSQHLAMGYP